MRLVRKSLLALLITALATPAFAQSGYNELGLRGGASPSGGRMAADLLIARPFGMVITAVGAAAFVVALPFSAAGGNVDQAGEALVLKPARETFVRCLGCRSAGRYVDPDTLTE